MHIAILFIASLTLLTQARAEVALGLAPFDRGISFWLEGSKTSLGIELEQFNLTWSTLNNEEEKLDKELTRGVEISLKYQLFLSKNQIAPFIYIGIYGGVAHYELDIWNGRNYQGETRNNSFSGLASGWGIRWKPHNKISLSAWQGLVFELYEKNHPIQTGYFGKETDALRMENARLLMLFHF